MFIVCERLAIYRGSDGRTNKLATDCQYARRPNRAAIGKCRCYKHGTPSGVNVLLESMLNRSNSYLSLVSGLNKSVNNHGQRDNYPAE
jgi:hypothetical protein